ncbi:dUTP diphosphatase [Planococcus dechangensis]|uniref:dUTP diphosphatase n=1 Tax=Planococcus dechangensis TaxID=1176255 RepID=A0ABV9MB56_9BACL
MELIELFEMQKKLDAEIELKHPVQPGENRIAKKLLALQTELGELSNEQRSWKFWSTDQEPRTNRQMFKECTTCDGLQYEPMFGQPCPDCESQGSKYCGDKNPLLEEYVDCIHFVLSIGNELKFKEYHLVGKYAGELHNTVDMFLFVNEQIALLSKTYRYRGDTGPVALTVYYSMLLEAFLLLGEALGFTWEQIAEAYLAKNKTNWERQKNAY